MRRSDSDCASANLFRRMPEEAAAPGAASANRAGVRVGVAVAVPSLAAAAACLATWAGGLLSGDDGVSALLPETPGMPPRPRDSPGFDQGLCFVPSRPASRQKVSRGCRTAAFDARAAGAYKPTSRRIRLTYRPIQGSSDGGAPNVPRPLIKASTHRASGFAALPCDSS